MHAHLCTRTKCIYFINLFTMVIRYYADIFPYHKFHTSLLQLTLICLRGLILHRCIQSRVHTHLSTFWPLTICTDNENCDIFPICVSDAVRPYMLFIQNSNRTLCRWIVQELVHAFAQADTCKASSTLDSVRVLHKWLVWIYAAWYVCIL